MINGIGQGDGLARAAIEAALRAQADAAKTVDAKVAQSLGTSGVFGAPAAEGSSTDFAAKLVDGLREAQGAVKDVERLPLETASGSIRDFAELAARLKQSELTFKFALEVRNKLIDAYRETMRMSV